MDFSDDIGKEGGVVTLNTAILLYGDSQRKVATIHPIAFKGSRPIIMAGHPASVAALQSLVVQLTTGKNSTYLAENILSASFTRIVWWVPSKVRLIWFKPGLGTDGKKARECKLNGKAVTHPNLVFCLSDGGRVRVFAIAREQRPTVDTVLYQAPYWNVSSQGGVCQGSAQKGRLLTPSEIGKYEKGFFESEFTHNTVQGGTTRHPDGHYGFWKALVSKRKKDVPVKWLRRYKKTFRVGDLIDQEDPE